MSEIGLIIAKERIKKNMSKHRLAQLVGCTTRAIEYWENGKRNMSLDNASKVFKALEIVAKIGYVKEGFQIAEKNM
jgi:transcriptional regulator with XRE-family HTH domain